MPPKNKREDTQKPDLFDCRVITQPLRRAVRWSGPFSGLRFGEHPRACSQGNNSWLPHFGVGGPTTRVLST